VTGGHTLIVRYSFVDKMRWMSQTWIGKTCESSEGKDNVTKFVFFVKACSFPALR
jgi:hypothetical protein